MDNLNQPLSPTLLAMNYMGDVVFAVSGALTAGRNKMDLIGYVMIGTITGIGGGLFGIFSWGARFGGPSIRRN